MAEAGHDLTPAIQCRVLRHNGWPNHWYRNHRWRVRSITSTGRYYWITIACSVIELVRCECRAQAIEQTIRHRSIRPLSMQAGLLDCSGAAVGACSDTSMTNCQEKDTCLNRLGQQRDTPSLVVRAAWYTAQVRQISHDATMLRQPAHYRGLDQRHAKICEHNALLRSEEN